MPACALAAGGDSEPIAEPASSAGWNCSLASVTDMLIHHDLLDQLRIWLHPVLVGSGELDDLMIRPRTKAKLKLAEARQYDTGLLILFYEPQRSAAGT